MEYRKIDLGAINGSIQVKIIRKEIKQVHLKVFRDLNVVLSIPYNVPDEWIDSLLQKKATWIDAQITKYKHTTGYNILAKIKNGVSTQLLGKDVRIYLEKGRKNTVIQEDNRIIVYLESLTEDSAQKVFDKWWREMAADIYQRELHKLYESVFQKHKLVEPEINVRKMKTLWGSCTGAKNKITLNTYLLKADLRCIQYVILHELSHFIYPNHSKEFYDFLTIYMPDWKERKKQLDTEVVQGL